MTARAAGLLLHPTSLPGRFGVGDLGPGAREFLEWAGRAGARLWQVLPLHPAGPGESPYGSLSAFAGNPLLISPELLAEEGLLTADEIASAPAFPAERFDAAGVRRWKGNLWRSAWSRFRGAPAASREAFEAFRAAPEQSPWLADWALFAALSQRHRDAGWVHWPWPLARREPEALREAARELADDVAYQQWLQFLFRRQWDGIRGHRPGAGPRGGR